MFIPGHLKQNVHAIPSQWKRLGIVHVPVILPKVGRKNKRIMVQAGLGNKQYPISKITKAKGAGGLTQW
jgi:hypothetical protein